MIGSNRAFTLIELIIVVAVIALLTTMAIPNFLRTRLMTRQTVCQNNLRQIEGAVDRWVFENNISEGAAVGSAEEQVIYSYLRGGKPVCPAGGAYIISNVGTSPAASCNIEGHTLDE